MVRFYAPALENNSWKFYDIWQLTAIPLKLMNESEKNLTSQAKIVLHTCLLQMLEIFA